MSEGEERLPDGGVELQVQHVEVVLVAPAAGPLTRHRRIGVEDDREVRLQALGRPAGQRGDLLVAQVASRGLVGARGVDVAIRDDDAAALQHRPHERCDVVRAVGGEDECLRTRRDTVAVQDDRAELRAGLGAAGLPSRDDFPRTPIAQCLRQQVDLRGLAGAVPALERDEEAATRVEAHGRRSRVRGLPGAQHSQVLLVGVILACGGMGSLGSVTSIGGGDLGGLRLLVLDLSRLPPTRGPGRLREAERVDDVHTQAADAGGAEREERDDASHDGDEADEDVRDVRRPDRPGDVLAERDLPAHAQGGDDDGTAHARERPDPAREGVALRAHAQPHEECDAAGEHRTAGELRQQARPDREDARCEEREGRQARARHAGREVGAGLEADGPAQQHRADDE